MEDRKLTVRAVERALDILMCFTKDSDLGLSEIAGAIGLHKSTVHRLLTTLEERGFVIRNPATDKYRLGLKIWELSAHLSHNDDPAVLLLPQMEQLRDRLGETVSLYLRDGTDRLRIQAVQSNQAIRRVAQVGARLPLFVGASSKVLVAYAEDAVLRAVLDSPDWPTAVDREAYMSQLEEIRRAGYATSYEEREPGAAAVAAPIFDRNGRVAAALSVSGPVSRLSPQTLEKMAPVLIEAAREMGMMIHT
ncbi:IclR family transcriptional regulator [Paenibacillus sp. alder61]|uniref:Glycerol operon regulatory protein n=1 Tax=Paenibacillus faecis TaxID=862114 RepID=A0A5D0CQT9_9BACL|nr:MULTISPECIES: IclR family transcriptional regulator [Paenibacillus]MCA1296468.1 IclR family transcriptional regulator [Paenibacillus sp. alder61]TYA11684.1 IclR family transcriptional regulator [Paenibacillus faecis]